MGYFPTKIFRCVQCNRYFPSPLARPCCPSCHSTYVREYRMVTSTSGNASELLYQNTTEGCTYEGYT